MNPPEVAIQSFLRLGYFIDFQGDPRPINFAGIHKERYRALGENDLVMLGIESARVTFESLFDRQRDIVVPISGGLDSRFILAALCELTSPANIHTYTYGVPGTYDYDLGCAVAKEAGTRHVAFPLCNMSYHLDDVLEVARRERCQAILFHSPPLREVDRLFAGAQVWSGYVGDAIAGGHVKSSPSPDPEVAKHRHLNERTFVRSTRLHSIPDEELIPHMACSSLDPEDLTWDEQVLFSEAVRKFTAQHALIDGLDYVTPLINTPWADFMLSAPNDYRRGERLFIRIAREMFPRLFSLPSKNMAGRTFDTPAAFVKLVRYANKGRKLLHQVLPFVSSPYTMYDDFNENLRKDRSLQTIVRESIDELRLRKIVDWIDVDRLWKRHMSRLRNHGDALIVLASLELNLQARETSGRGPAAE